MTDPQIRLALKTTALAEHFQDPDAVVLDELGLRHGAARVDVAVVNGLIHGFEIKSDRDTLLRLPQQVALYGSVLDEVTLVVGPRHLKEACEIVPSWWGIEKVTLIEEQVVFDSLRPPTANPKIDALSVAKLLWRDEALALLKERDAARGYASKPRLSIYKRVIDIVSLDELRARVRRQLKLRAGRTPDR